MVRENDRKKNPCVSHTMFPAQIRSGLSTGQSNDATGACVQRLMALVLLLVKKSAKSAALYCKHQGIAEVDVPHIRRALKYESMCFFDGDSLEEETDALIEQIHEWDETLSTESDDISGILNKMVDQVEEDTAREATTLLCRCSLCTGLEGAEEAWASYNPDDEAKAFLKTQMDHIDTLYDAENYNDEGE